MASATHASSSMTKIVRPARSFRGSLTLPGDKSISHRYAMLSGLAKGTSRLTNFSTGADPHSSLACMEKLGATQTLEGATIAVTGVGGSFQQPKSDLDCGNSGSTMRMLAGLVASHPGTYRFIGDESLTVRPMERIRKPLESMGARIDLTEGHAPMTVHGGSLKAIDFEAPIASAQVKTAVLFAGLGASGTTSFVESVKTRDHSEHALRAFGVELERHEDRVYIEGGQKLAAVDMTVPGDMSSAAFFLCGALLFED
jgi:3-phosphoshikimate 1-carboxyvinyltransferase